MSRLNRVDGILDDVIVTGANVIIMSIELILILV